MMSNYFVIHTVNRDGQFIYYDKVFIKSNLSMKELETDDFEMKFLDWEFCLDEPISKDDEEFWSDGRCVYIEDIYEVDVEDITVLKKYHYFIDLDKAMKLKEQNDE